MTHTISSERIREVFLTKQAVFIYLFVYLNSTSSNVSGNVEKKG